MDALDILSAVLHNTASVSRYHVASHERPKRLLRRTPCDLHLHHPGQKPGEPAKHGKANGKSLVQVHVTPRAGMPEHAAAKQESAKKMLSRRI